jgi:hypothetical protein
MKEKYVMIAVPPKFLDYLKKKVVLRPLWIGIALELCNLNSKEIKSMKEESE